MLLKSKDNIKQKMMKIICLTLLCSLGLAFGAMAQVEQHRKPITQEVSLPFASSYKIVKNETGSPISEKVLASLNAQRKDKENYLWKVSPQIEILVYSREHLAKNASKQIDNK